MEKIRVGIAGYGNLGRGTEDAIRQNDDMELLAVFTRRDPKSLEIKTPGAAVVSLDDAEEWKDKLDVVIICGGSATDLPEMTPKLAKIFNVVDSFDTHANIPQHIKNTGEAAKAAGNLAVVSAGWDPGLFSIARIYEMAALPKGETYTFWGPGVSQGHSDAIRRIKGVLDARQYTIPVPEALERVRTGENPELTTREKHTRLCYVVAEEGADLERIENEIKTMKNYFDQYDTTVNFVSEEELLRDHGGMPHGGFVIRSGRTAGDCAHTVEFSLKLESNPQFTSSVLCSCARAAVRMARRGETGCATMAEIRPCDLLPLSADEIHEKMI